MATAGAVRAETEPRDSGRLHGGHQRRPRCGARDKSGAGAVFHWQNRVSSREKRGGFQQEWIELISPASIGDLGSLNHQMVHGDMRNMTQLVYLEGMAYWNVREGLAITSDTDMVRLDTICRENSKVGVCSCKREFQPLNLCIFSGILVLKTKMKPAFPENTQKES